MIKAMQDVVDFWIDKGVDGFRIDVIDMISKDFEKNKMGLVLAYTSLFVRYLTERKQDSCLPLERVEYMILMK